MKISIIVIGSIFLFLAVISFIVPISGNQYSILQAYNLCNSTLGSIGQAFSEQAQENCINANSWLAPIFSIGFVGFILLIIGFIKK